MSTSGWKLSKRSTALIFLLLMGAIGFVLGWAARGVDWESFLLWHPNPTGEQPLEDQDTMFSTLVNDWNKRVIENKGYIPGDPYRALVDWGVVTSYAGLRQINFVGYIPPRLNPDLSLNPKKAIFCQTRTDLKSQWVAYANGTWERLSTNSTPAEFRYDDYVSAGYAHVNMKERDAWIERNRARLVWDSGKRMYLVTEDNGTTNRAP